MPPNAPDAAPAGRAHSALGILLAPTALLCGALVMVIEVMGSRVIGPFFGVSLFVWTSLITVTLVSLAAGYAAGGLLSARRGTPDVLYGAILGAGVLALAVPFLRAPVLHATVPLGLRAGALVASGLLFGPSLFLLGWVSPLLVRIAARELHTVGRTAGTLAALSIVGSFAGTLLTGFVLVAWLGVERIFQLVGLSLVLLAATWFAGVRRRWVALAPVALGLVFAGERPLVTKLLPDGTRLEVLERIEGFYGSVRIVDYVSPSSARLRDMVLEGQIQGGMDVATGLSPYEYVYFLAYLPWAARPGGGRCLVVGLGGGLVPRLYESLGVVTDVVEINPDVVAAARRWFGYRGAGDVLVDDGRHVFTTSGRTWDYVVLDVFSGDATPGHLLSVEAMREIAARLAPGGVLAVNYVGSVAPNAVTSSVLRTIRAVFPVVSVRTIDDGEGPSRVSNVIVIASREPLDFVPARVAALPIHPAAAAGVRARLFRPVELPVHPAAVVLSDDFNPVDAWDVKVREEMRRHMLASTDPDVLL